MSTVSNAVINSKSVKASVVTHESALDESLNELWSHIGRYELVKNVVGLSVVKKFTSTVNGVIINNKVSVLVLCAGYHCLIIQLIHFKTIPSSLARFLDLPHVTFVGVGIKQNLAKLRRDYGLECCNGIDLGQLAADVLKMPYLSACGVGDIAIFCNLDNTYRKPASVDLGDWGTTKTLSQEQTRLATLDAYALFVVGNHLLQGFFPPIDSDDDYCFSYL